MKAKILLSSIALIILLLNSCDKLEFGNEFLDKADSGSDVTKDTIFNSFLYANRYLTSGYATLPYGVPTTNNQKGNKIGVDLLESFTDLSHTYLTWGSMNRFYYNNLYGPAVETDFPFDTKYSFTKEFSWDGIRVGWNIVENADRIPAPKPEDLIAIKKMKAEAKMIIALHYCDMYRHYGGMPWVDKVYTAEGVSKLPRLTSLETLNKIVDLIDEAAADLPWTNLDKNDDGRFTKASALGLKARILLFGASPLFNSDTHFYPTSTDKSTWHGSYDPSLWSRAKDAAKALLDQAEANGYALVSTGNYRKDFQDAYYKRGNGEVLISTRVRFAGLDFWNANYYFYQAASEYGIACPTKEYVDMFPMDNGLKTSEDPRYDPTNKYANRDPRLYETVLVNGDAFQGRTVELYEGGREAIYGAPINRTGFKIRKFLLDTDRFASSVRGLPVHWPYLRLAEIYLSYAEALNELSGPTPEAHEAVNKVRNRVGLGNLKTDLSKDEFRQAVLTERALEFGYEEVRFFDITRHKLDNVFKNKLHGEITRATNAAKTTFSYTETELPVRGWSTQFSRKWYLSAFPATEVNKGYGLTQNPGW